MIITVEKSVPLPVVFDASVFERMQVGQSFLLPANSVLPGTLRYYASMHGKRLGRAFSVRKTPDGYRCWRVA